MACSVLLSGFLALRSAALFLYHFLAAPLRVHSLFVV
jgi:hypothetical protein